MKGKTTWYIQGDDCTVLCDFALFIRSISEDYQQSEFTCNHLNKSHIHLKFFNRILKFLSTHLTGLATF